MAGYDAVLEIRRLEKDLDDVGLMLCAPKHGSWGSNEYNDRAGVKPKDAEALPIYNRDAELFTGSLSQIRVWLIGVQWARQYDMMLRLSDEKKRTKKEDDYRHRQMLQNLKRDYIGEQEESV